MGPDRTIKEYSGLHGTILDYNGVYRIGQNEKMQDYTLLYKTMKDNTSQYLTENKLLEKR